VRSLRRRTQHKRVGVGPHGSNVAAAVRPEVTASGAPTKVADAASAAIESTGGESERPCVVATDPMTEACGDDTGAASMPLSRSR